MLTVTAEPVSPGTGDAFDIHDFPALTTVLRMANGGEHLLFSDGIRHLQLHLTTGSVLEGPVRFHYALRGFHQAEPGLVTLRRLCQLWRLGRLPRQLYAAEPVAERWLLALRAHDGMAAGASRREIAAALFGERAVREDWAGRSDYLRLRVQRLLRIASRLVSGGYRDILKRRWTAREA
ncbi:DUF2285 domain-containing protein [Magnetospirillum sp. 15-1]|uniref:DNA -binding domain-containing protein n=1 Tax=Magnetospirillum sp. 15-1 TaxID=1979370 RepID=UPI001483CF13|nr:DUF2285 domain-containing protein [Magnetospirillum sp. 15-1]